MGPRHLAQCYRCRRTFEADQRGARYCPECEQEQRRRFRVLPGGRDARQGRLIVHPRAAGPLQSRSGKRRPPAAWGDGWRHSWRWRRWHQPLRLVAVVALAAAARTAWELGGGGPWPVEWLVYAAGAYWIWNRRDQAA